LDVKLWVAVTLTTTVIIVLPVQSGRERMGEGERERGE